MKSKNTSTLLSPDAPGIDDEEGERVPEGLPPVIDAHVHIFPGNIFSSIWAWFDENAWPIRYRLSSADLLAYLLSHGESHVIALQYAHKPDISRMLNQHMVESCREFPGRVTGMAAVFPGEENAGEILREAFGQGLVGVKLHAQVQCFGMNAQEMETLYDVCELEQSPMVMHVGREPKSTAYRCDPYELRSGKIVVKARQIFRKQGILLPVEVSARMLPDGRVLGIVRDITERKRVERALLDRERHLRLLTENMVDAISQINADRLIVYCSPSVERMFGFSPQDLIGTPAYENVYPEDACRIRQQAEVPNRVSIS